MPFQPWLSHIDPGAGFACDLGFKPPGQGVDGDPGFVQLPPEQHRDAAAGIATGGDLRAGVTGPLSDNIAINAELIAPTSELSEGVAATLRLAVGSDVGALSWRTNVGVTGSTAVEPAVLLGVGGEQELGEWLRLGLEGKGTLGGVRSSGLVDGYLTVGPSHAPVIGTVAGGVGVGGGPLFRVAMGLSWRWGSAGGDLDADGIVDALDACPAAPEDRDDWQDSDGCPDPDNDADTLTDAMDLCPMEAEDSDGWQDGDGCPDLDNDADGLLDDDDRCPDAPGLLAAGGCPDSDGDTLADIDDECPEIPGRVEAVGCPDWDGDSIPDHRDACPRDPAPPGADPLRSSGCPDDAFVRRERIEVMEPIHFEVDAATLSPSARALLLKVAALLEANPDIELVEIAGHADATGSYGYNLRLSRERAVAVRRFLVESGGIAASRLVLAGYGERRPVRDNLTEEGRALNRRVEFVILE